MTNTTLEFYTAEWCGACKLLKRDMDAAGIRYRTIDVDNAPGAGLDIPGGLYKLPTLVIRHNDTIVWNHSGMCRTHEIEEAINENQLH
jgi:glutaredoxin